ncbi:MAG TPA: MFS transporter [Candidatus Saccharimonadales bacterium]|jgi:MHS family shikimate/dehydroshikimate transporter-like MFS transporter|nr:MFS transporter [Candidatus Saccharimonadales bacterium]
MATQPEQDVGIRTLVILAFSATAGVMVEFYDFFIFGYAAASAFPKIFFPQLSETQALVFSYLTFGAGFPARLLGAFIFGHWGDRSGRKSSFVINLVMVGAATCLMGVLPGYATLGIMAPILLLLLRVVQGIGLGGEFGGASSLLAEFGAQRRTRAFWMSLANMGIPLGGMSASAMLLVLNKSFAANGWRIAMLLSLVIVAPALLARYKLADSPLFERMKRREQLAAMPSLAVFKQHAAPILLLAMVSAFQQMDGYVSGTYIISFMKFAGVPLVTTASILMVGRVGDILGVALSGPAADLLKRRTVAYVAIGITTLLSYPFVLAIVGKRMVLVMLLQFLINFFGIGLLHGLAPILTSESFPTRFRYSGSGISYSFSAILGGMIAPQVLAGLIGQDVRHKWYFVPVVYAVYCAVAMLALVFIRETRDIRLEELDGTQGPSATS